MNCSICLRYLRDEKKCPGCKERELNCGIRDCKVIKKKNLNYCYQCSEFPCPRMKRMDKRYRTKYNMSVVENLENIKKSGIRKFVKAEKARWACSECGGTMCVHDGHCHSCEEKK